jgi:hypothetical protein
MPRLVFLACGLAGGFLLSGHLSFMPGEHSRLSIASPAEAAAQEPLLTEFNRRQKLFDAKKYQEVVKQAAEFLKQIRSRFGADSHTFALAENMIVSSYVSLDRAEDAIPYLEHKHARLDASGSEDAWTLHALEAHTSKLAASVRQSRC